MMTQTHLLVASAIFVKPRNYAVNTATIVGSLLPDFALYALFAYERAKGTSPEIIFNELYWSPQWQALLAPGNSFVVYGILAVLAFAFMKEANMKVSPAGLLWVFSASALMHLALDFPLHVEDAYAHFWPLTDWKFTSPISYWDHSHYGYLVQPVELVLGLICIAVMYRRFSALWIKVLLAACFCLYILIPLSFALLPDQLLGS